MSGAKTQSLELAAASDLGETAFQPSDNALHAPALNVLLTVSANGELTAIDTKSGRSHELRAAA